MFKTALLCGSFWWAGPSVFSAELPSETVQLETRFLRFSIAPASGACEILDKRAGVTWRPASAQPRLGWAKLNSGDQSGRVDLSRCEIQRTDRELIASFTPFAKRPLAKFRVTVSALPDDATLELSYQEDRELEAESVALLPEVFGMTDTNRGQVLVPVREGLLVPSDSGLNYSHRFDTYAYEGCHMAMLGLTKQGAAALLTWRDPYVAAELNSTANPTAAPGERQRLNPSLVLTRSARSFRVQFLGHGNYVDIAKAYRQTAQERGWLVTWDQKLRGHPDRAKLFGAANIKLWSTLDRTMNEASTKEESVRVNWTFDEAAQVAEHLKQDLKLDRVLFTVGGWIHRGYDNQHPDILPTAPECGGDAAFADCARRVLKQGYLLCLHDNYQDIYRDSPSWSERFIMKTSDGKLARGGHWAGGMAFLTCAQEAVTLAKRPQNLAAVKKLSNANSYFIDTTYAAGLQECFDPAHPLTRADDMKWKQALSDYAREVFGVFGSECGREWAIPHSDFFEGLTGVSGTYYHDAKLPAKLGAVVVPMFDLVYRDSIAMYGKYGYEPTQAAEYVLHHITLARPLNYHSIPAHLYWKNPVRAESDLDLQPTVSEVKQTSPRQFQIRYQWIVGQPAPGDWQVFVHFTDASGAIKFQNDHVPVPPVAAWKPGTVDQGPFTVTIPDGLSGKFNVRMGLFQGGGAERALLRGRDNGERSYLAGKLTLDGEKISFQPSERPAQVAGDAALFTHAENGWAAGLHPMDRFLKNTCEVLSPLNELTAQMQMTSHEFLTADQKVQRTLFGQGGNAVSVIVNFGTNAYSCSSKQGGKVELPPHGFLVESPTFTAFYASSWREVAYPIPTLFTLRSLDQQPLARSRQVRIFHAFGDDPIRVGKNIEHVQREAVVNVRAR